MLIAILIHGILLCQAVIGSWYSNTLNKVIYFQTIMLCMFINMFNSGLIPMGFRVPHKMCLRTGHCVTQVLYY